MTSLTYNELKTAFENIDSEYNKKMVVFNQKIKDYNSYISTTRVRNNDYFKKLQNTGATGDVSGYVYNSYYKTNNSFENGVAGVTGVTGADINSCINSCVQSNSCYGASYSNSKCYLNSTPLELSYITKTTNTSDVAIIPKDKYMMYEMNTLISELTAINNDRVTAYTAMAADSSFNVLNDNIDRLQELNNSSKNLKNTLDQINNTQKISEDSGLIANKEKTVSQFLLIFLFLVLYLTFTYLNLPSSISIMFLVLGGILAVMLIVIQIL